MHPHHQFGDYVNGYDITWAALFLGSLILLIPIYVFYYYQTGLVKDTLIAFGRMLVQLMLVGLYLELIFEIDSPYINLAWVIVMIIAASYSVGKRSDLKLKFIFIPVLTAITTNVVINGSVFGFIVIGTEHILEARYIIPLMGMIIGNTLNAAIIGIRTYFNKIKSETDKFKYDLLCGATLSEALISFNTGAYREAFNPVIASTAVIGLIWLPGMMTGQILSGSNPMTAIKYQVIIIITIFAGSVITIFTTLALSKKFAFDEYDNLRKDIFKTR